MVLVSSVAAVRFIIVCGAVAIVKELPGVSKSIRRWPLIISIRSLAILTDFGTVAKLAMRQPFVLFKGLTFQKL
ncbi:hypothetical protein RCK28_23005, partial [Salmonella enterica subsp. enterica serovar 1,4,[5],12:i:-]